MAQNISDILALEVITDRQFEDKDIGKVAYPNLETGKFEISEDYGYVVIRYSPDCHATLDFSPLNEGRPEESKFETLDQILRYISGMEDFVKKEKKEVKMRYKKSQLYESMAEVEFKDGRIRQVECQTEGNKLRWIKLGDKENPEFVKVNESNMKERGITQIFFTVPFTLDIN